MRKLFPFCILCVTLTIFSLFVNATHIYEFPDGNHFPIMGYHSFEIPEMATDSNYRIFKEAGFNIALNTYRSPEYVAQTLTYCLQNNIKSFYSVPRGFFNDSTRFEAIINNWPDHPACAGMLLYDEPNFLVFHQLAHKQEDFYSRVTALGRNYRDQLCYVNLFPTYASSAQQGTDTYQQYLSYYLDRVRPRFISFDHYGICAQNLTDTLTQYLRQDYYKNLELVSAAAREAGIPFWSFVLSSSHNIYPTPTMGHLKLQAFSGIAYGAQCIQYYGYATNTGRVDVYFNNAPYTINSTKFSTWYLIKELNQLIQSYSHYFLGMQVQKVWHTGSSIPEGTTSASNILSWTNKIFGVNSNGIGVLVSYFTNNNRHGIMVVNRDFANSQTVYVQYYGNINIVNVNSSNNLQDELEANEEEIQSQQDNLNIHYPLPNTVQFTLEPGDCKILTWGDTNDRLIF